MWRERHGVRVLIGPVRLLGFERVALVMLAFSLGISLFWSQLYGALWIGAVLLRWATWGAFALFAGFAVVSVLQDNLSRRQSWRAVLAFPVAFALAWVLNGPAVWGGYWLLGQWRLLAHGDAYAAAVGRAAGGPVAFKMVEGIPDGGVVLIHSPSGSPAHWPRAPISKAVGETIHECRRLNAEYHICTFD